MTELFRRLRYLLNRGRFDQELADDLEFHREMAARAGGLRSATRFGSAKTRAQPGAGRGSTACARTCATPRACCGDRQDSRSTAVVMLGIGIGANVAAFGFLNLVALRRCPVRDPDTLLRFERRSPRAVTQATCPTRKWRSSATHARTLSAVIAILERRLVLEGEGARLRAQFVTANFFSELGAPPRCSGVLLDPHRWRADAEPVVVFSHAFWKRQYGADPSVVGTTIHLNGKPATVVGVAVGGVQRLDLSSPDVWAAVADASVLRPWEPAAHDLLGRGRREDVGPDASRRIPIGGRTGDAAVAGVTLRAAHPDDIWEGETLNSAPGGYAKMGGGSSAVGTPEPNRIHAVFALVGALVLLILAVACGKPWQPAAGQAVSPGNASSRFAPPSALAAPGWFASCSPRACCWRSMGSAAGMGWRYALLRGLMVASGAPAWLDPAPDWRVFAFAVGIAVAAAIVFGLAPAWQVVRRRHRATLLRQCLIGAQVRPVACCSSSLACWSARSTA